MGWTGLEKGQVMPDGEEGRQQRGLAGTRFARDRDPAAQLHEQFEKGGCVLGQRLPVHELGKRHVQTPDDRHGLA